ncbi:hypothetical protein WR25_27046 [Diploscapter pachys]|uniref:BZIP domain-containing protein n=1 Tax=Diploscapter pachys TaxID=2018661 RepID=A0A2A2KCQ7_9BILA|nr:hypothetical protein WR25_27046 [Diploscapter pachys]
MGRKKNPPRHVDDNDPQEVKREKNRQAAERYRCKVKQEIKEWKNKCKDLETRNIQLTEKLKCAHSKLMELEKRTMCVHTQQMQTTARLVPYQSIPLTVSSNLAASTSVAPGAPQPSPSTTSSTASAASAASQWCLHKVIYDDPQWYIYQATDPSQFNHTADTPTSSRYCDISLEHLDISGEKKCSEAEQNCTSQMGNNLSPNNHSAQPLTNGQSTFPNMNSSVSTPVQGVQDIQGTGPGSAHIFVCNQAAISQDYHCDGGCNNRSYSH